MTARRVWVTRAQPGADATAERLRALGFEPLVAPLLEVRPLPPGRIDLAGVAALAFTSANGIAAFAANSPRRDLPVFAVGDATAAAARAAGFAEVVSAGGDVEALAKAIGGRQDAMAGDVLHAGAAEPAGDLVAALAAQGVGARRLAVYETIAAPPPDPGAARRLLAAHAVLLHSPRAARAFTESARDAGPVHIAACCLSANVAAPLAGLALGDVRVAKSPDEDALLALLAT